MSSNFNFTQHAKERMAEIGIPEPIVLAAIRKPDRHRFKARRQIECSLDLSVGFTLAAVVCLDTGDVVTVYPQGVDRPAARRLTDAFKAAA